MTLDQVHALEERRDELKEYVALMKEMGADYRKEEREADALHAALQCIRNRCHVTGSGKSPAENAETAKTNIKSDSANSGTRAPGGAGGE